MAQKNLAPFFITSYDKKIAKKRENFYHFIIFFFLEVWHFLQFWRRLCHKLKYENLEKRQKNASFFLVFSQRYKAPDKLKYRWIVTIKKRSLLTLCDSIHGTLQSNFCIKCVKIFLFAKDVSFPEIPMKFSKGSLTLEDDCMKKT